MKKNMQRKILITSNSFGKFDPRPKQMLIDAGFHVEDNPSGRMLTENELLNQIEDADAIIVSTEHLDKKVIDHAKKLKVVSRYGVGTDNIDVEYCRAKGIPVTITQHCNTNAVAEYSVALMLNAARGICSANDYAKSNQWKKFTGLDLTGKTVGIIGLGSIGKEVIKKLQGFNVNILVNDTFYDDQFITQYHLTKASLNTLLQQSDFISLHVPALDSKPLLTELEFALMKQNVVLINTARASLICINALIDNLQSKKIFSIALDVHEKEPQFDKRLTQFENVILTPHNAAVSREAIDKMSMLAAQNVLNHIEPL